MEDLQDYTVGTDMTTEHPSDTEIQLHINRRKYYNFDIDAVDKQFSYVDDEDSEFIRGKADLLDKAFDSELLTMVADVRPGNWIGVNLRTLDVDGGAGDGADTSASITTAAAGGSITIDATGAVTENQVDGKYCRAGFYTDVLGLPIRLNSSTGYSTEWYRIIGITSTAAVTIENWDGNVQVSSSKDAPAGDVLYGMHGVNVQNADVYTTAENGWFIEIQAAIPTTLTATNVYNAVTDLKCVLDENECPDEDRHLIMPPAVQKLLGQASQLQPDIAMYYNQVVINGKVGRVAGFDVHMVSSSRFSTRASRFYALTAPGSEDWANVATGAVLRTTGYQFLACHKEFCSFAHKWAESRVVDSQLQFAKLYQGLNLYGFRVPPMRRKLGALLYATI